MARIDWERATITIAIAVMLVLAGCSSGSEDAGNLGYAAGGAQGAEAFRENVDAGYLPISSDITHEGLFYDYSFETGERECAELFCPAYSRAVTTDPLSNETEQYLSVGLNSNVDESEFEREKLNLVVVLDVSGSMDSGMAEYHYDGDGPDGREERRAETTKMDAANEATVALLDQLEDDDRFALVTFDDRTETVASLERMDERDRDGLEEEILAIEADGGTNLESGMGRARELVEPYADEEGYETRVVYLTDAMPNVGDTSTGGLESRLRADAEQGVHSTFVGVGMDFNSGLVDEITAVRGANYYAVHSAERFEERMGEEFEYMVTPMVYDLELAIESEGYEIEAVYGSPDADEATGELLSVNTLFPSPTEDGASRGGVVLLELNRTGDDPDLELTASYDDRDGQRHETTERVTFDDREPEYFETDAVRKAVVLSRYATLMGNWIDHERASLAGDDPEPPRGGLERTDAPHLGEWERQSVDLHVSPEYAERIDAFRGHFVTEADSIGDDTLDRELETMETILGATGEKANDDSITDVRDDENESTAMAPP